MQIIIKSFIIFEYLFSKMVNMRLPTAIESQELTYKIKNFIGQNKEGRFVYLINNYNHLVVYDLFLNRQK
jgi:hypothetical protein